MHTSLIWSELSAHFSWFFVVQIILLILCAGTIGCERQLRHKPAGMRTSILIALGSMLFVKYSNFLLGETANADPTRVIGQVVTGIGFLGAGTIMNREGLVTGLTTAATIWVQAAIGVLIAAGYLIDAVLFSIITVGILHGVTGLELFIRKIRKKRLAQIKQKKEISDGDL